MNKAASKNINKEGGGGLRPNTGSKNIHKQIGIYSANPTPKNAILTINQ